MAGAVEAETVDDASVAIQPKQPWARIARLRARRDRADFDKAKAERQKVVRCEAVLVEPGGKPDRIGEFQSECSHRQPLVVRRAWRQPGKLQRGERRVMRRFWIERVQERPREREQRPDHGISPVKSCVPSWRSGSESRR